MIRRASAEDVDALAPLYAAFFAEDGISVPLSSIRSNLAVMLGDPRACVLIAADADERLIGLSSASLSYGVEFGCSAELEDLYVVPARRGEGVARRLFEAARDWAAAAGARELGLVITAQAEAEQGLTSLYQRLGFARTGRILMSRAL
ncbi:MAG: GNAT family N-acetyltransferase [Pseudomonadota bacterium]